MQLSFSLLGRAFAVAVTALTAAAGSQATVVYDATISLAASNPTQLGRLSRSGTPSDWTSTKVFPGLINTGLAYHYKTLTLDVPALETGYLYSPYLQITFNSLVATTFLSAYFDTYTPTSASTNFAGDEGSSAFFGTDVAFFQLVQPKNRKLVLVLNETTPNAGLGLPGEIIIEAFSDTQYSDLVVAPPVPEPASVALIAGGLAVVALARRRRSSTRSRMAA